MASYDDLWTAVKARYSGPYLAQLTNPQNSSASGTSPNDTTGALAARDVVADFAKKGILYDNGVDTHVDTACNGVIAKLQQRTGQHEWAWKRHKEYLEDLDDLRLVTANDRLTPTSTSGLTQSDDNENGEETRPDMDREHFALMRPNPPLSGSSPSPTKSE